MCKRSNYCPFDLLERLRGTTDKGKQRVPCMVVAHRTTSAVEIRSTVDTTVTVLLRTGETRFSQRLCIPHLNLHLCRTKPQPKFVSPKFVPNHNQSGRASTTQTRQGSCDTRTRTITNTRDADWTLVKGCQPAQRVGNQHDFACLSEFTLFHCTCGSSPKKFYVLRSQGYYKDSTFGMDITRAAK